MHSALPSSLKSIVCAGPWQITTCIVTRDTARGSEGIDFPRRDSITRRMRSAQTGASIIRVLHSRLTK